MLEIVSVAFLVEEGLVFLLAGRSIWVHVMILSIALLSDVMVFLITYQISWWYLLLVRMP